MNARRKAQEVEPQGCLFDVDELTADYSVEEAQGDLTMAREWLAVAQDVTRKPIERETAGNAAQAMAERLTQALPNLAGRIYRLASETLDVARKAQEYGNDTGQLSLF